MRVKVFEPFRSFKPFYSDFDSWFNGAANGPESEGVAWNPSVDVYETDNSYVLKADLPGIKKEDINLDVNNNTLTIKGDKIFEEKVEKDNYLRIERRYGSFSRSFTLSEKVDKENITANYKNGVLEVTLPKKEEAKPKEIKVEVN
jgi:HSP20 family protein